MSAILDHASVEEIIEHLHDLHAIRRWHTDQHNDEIARQASLRIDRLLELLWERRHDR